MVLLYYTVHSLVDPPSEWVYGISRIVLDHALCLTQLFLFLGLSLDDMTRCGAWVEINLINISLFILTAMPSSVYTDLTLGH